MKRRVTLPKLGWTSQRSALVNARLLDYAEDPGPPAHGELGQLAQSVLHAIGLPVLLMSSQGRFCFANPLGRALLRDGGPLSLVDNHVAPLCPEDTAELEAALRRCRQGLRSLMFLRGKRKDRLELAAVTPVGAAPDPMAMVVFGASPAARHLAQHFFAKRTALTLAEQQVLEQLCSGQGPQEIADSHRVAVCTVRTQIQALRVKTDTRNIQNLIALVMALPPMGPHLV